MPGTTPEAKSEEDVRKILIRKNTHRALKQYAAECDEPMVETADRIIRGALADAGRPVTARAATVSA